MGEKRYVSLHPLFEGRGCELWLENGPLGVKKFFDRLGRQEAHIMRVI